MVRLRPRIAALSAIFGLYLAFQASHEAILDAETVRDEMAKSEMKLREAIAKINAEDDELNQAKKRMEEYEMAISQLKASISRK